MPELTSPADIVSQDPDINTLNSLSEIDFKDPDKSKEANAAWGKSQGAITGLFVKVHEGTLPVAGVARALDGAIQRAEDSENEAAKNLFGMNLLQGAEYLRLLGDAPERSEGGRFTPEDRDAIASLVDRTNKAPIRIYGGRGNDVGEVLDHFIQDNPGILNTDDHFSASLRTLGETYIAGRAKDVVPVSTVAHLKAAFTPQQSAA